MYFDDFCLQCSGHAAASVKSRKLVSLDRFIHSDISPLVSRDEDDSVFYLAGLWDSCREMEFHSRQNVVESASLRCTRWVYVEYKFDQKRYAFRMIKFQDFIGLHKDMGLRNGLDRVIAHEKCRYKTAQHSMDRSQSYHEQRTSKSKMWANLMYLMLDLESLGILI